VVVAEGDVVELWSYCGEGYHEFVEFVHAEFFDVGDGAVCEEDVVGGLCVGFYFFEFVVECFFGGALRDCVYCDGLFVFGEDVFFVVVLVDEGDVF